MMKPITPLSMEHRIYLIRGLRVMLDQDLAVLYGVTTKRLNEQVKRNRIRFPSRYMFRLSDGETGRLRSQFGVGLRNSVEGFSIARDSRSQSDESCSPTKQGPGVGSAPGSPQEISNHAGHRFDGVGGGWKMELWMRLIGTVIGYRPEKVPQNGLKTQGDGFHPGDRGQTHQEMLKAYGVGSFEGFADQLVKLFADCSAFELPPGSFPLGLQLADEVEMTELENPPVLFGNFLHSIQIVDDKRPGPKPGFDGKRREHLLPTKSAFFAGEQHGVEKSGCFPGARLHGDQVKDPRSFVEMKAEAIGQQRQGTTRKLLGMRSRYEALERLAETVTEIR